MSEQKGLEVSDVSHQYGNRVSVSSACLEVEPGNVHCLLGHSGSGKTTLLRIIAGLERALTGEINIAGNRVAGEGIHQPTENRAIGFVFQNYALFPHLSVLRNVMFGITHCSRKEKRELAMNLLRQVELSEYSRSMPHALSGGQQQRVALARALARKPAVMLLDEPFSELDSRLRSEVREITLRVLRASDAATLMVTHDPQEALTAGDRVSVMREGLIEQTASPHHLYNHPVNEHTARIFGVINSIPPTSNLYRKLSPADGNENRLVRPEQIHLAQINDDRQSRPSHGNEGVIVQINYEGPTVLIQSQLASGRLIWTREFTPTKRHLGEAVQLVLTQHACSDG